MKKSIPKSNLGEKVSGNMDDILYGKPPAKAQDPAPELAEKRESRSPASRPDKAAPKKNVFVGEEESGEAVPESAGNSIEKPARVGRPALTDKIKKHGVMAYFNQEIYDEFEDVSGSIKKEVRKQLGLKLKETNLIELCVAYVNESYADNPRKVIEGFLKLCENQLKK